VGPQKHLGVLHRVILSRKGMAGGVKGEIEGTHEVLRGVIKKIFKKAQD